MKSQTIIVKSADYKPRRPGDLITPNMMKYKIVAGSRLFDRLIALFERVEECRALTHEILDEFGVTEWTIPSDKPLAGGISGMKLDKQPEGWKRVSQRYYHNLYFPKVIPANKKLLARIAALPTINREDLNQLVGFERQWVGFTQYSSPGIHWGYDFHLLEVPEEAHYTPIDGMEEITTSEFKQLKGIIDNTDKEILA